MRWSTPRPASLPTLARCIGKADVASQEASIRATPSTVLRTEVFLFTASDIHPDLIQAYTETEFRVLEGNPFTLRIGKVSNDLLVAHKRHRVECSAFITSCNPFSQELTDEANAERQKALAKELASRSLEFMAGIGQHPSNQWSGEPSYLIFGLTLEAAKTLGNRLEQNAIVWNGSDGAPQLILLR